MPSMETYDAIMLVSYGGPNGQEDVLPFMRNATRGRGIPDERLLQVAAHYKRFGGVSPINACNQRLIADLSAELARRGLGEVFAVLATPRVRGVGGGGQDEDAPGTGPRERVEAFGDEGVPVAVSPSDGDVVPAASEFRGQVRDQTLVAGIDGRDATETLVVSGHLKQTLIGDSTTARRVAHERQDVVRAVRATVGQQHDRVVGFQTWHFQSSFRPRGDSVGPLPSPTQRQIVRKTQ